MTKEEFAKASAIDHKVKETAEHHEKVKKMIVMANTGSANTITIHAEGSHTIDLYFNSDKPEILELLDVLNAAFTHRITRLNKELKDI